MIGDLKQVNDQILSHRYEELRNTTNEEGQIVLTVPELNELLEIERELTIREG